METKSNEESAGSSRPNSTDSQPGSHVGLLSKKTGHRSRRSIYVFIALGTAVVILLAVLLPVLLHEKNRSPSSASDPSSAFADLGYAQYQGTQLANGVNQYLGMRFAKAPLGDLRWRAPVDPPEDTEIQQADSFGKVCLGISTPLPTDLEDEDCLFANVWAPADATASSKLPVWLFIQGGGYITNSNANWNGSEVVEVSGRNIVLVNFNYRVGLWGFLASEKIRENGDLNVGLLDQRQVMKWVKAHITEFGGDPDQVVIHGASAGAGSVGLHLIANGGRDDHLFHGAIGESPFFPAQPMCTELEWQFDTAVSQTRCTAGDQMACLRNLSATDIQALANLPSPFPNGTDAPLFYFTPCIDGSLLQDLPMTMFTNGQFIQVPIIFGDDTDEGTYFAPPSLSSLSSVLTFFQNNYPKLTPNTTSSLLALYPQQSAVPMHDSYFPAAATAYGEATFTCPGMHILSSFHGHAPTVPAWSYRYNVLDESNVATGVGVPHLWESWAVFGPDNLAGPGGGSEGYYTYNRNIVPVVMAYWISFVRTLDPNALREAGAPEWNLWGDGNEGGSQRLLFETNKTRMEDVPTEQISRCGMWEQLTTVMEQR